MKFHNLKLLKYNLAIFVASFSVRNILIVVAALSAILGLALLVTSVMLLDGLRKETEIQFKGTHKNNYIINYDNYYTYTVYIHSMNRVITNNNGNIHINVVIN